MLVDRAHERDGERGHDNFDSFLRSPEVTYECADAPLTEWELFGFLFITNDVEIFWIGHYFADGDFNVVATSGDFLVLYYNRSRPILRLSNDLAFFVKQLFQSENIRIRG